MNRKVLIVIVVVILLAIPTVLFIASGDFFPQKAEPYDVGFISENDRDTVFVRNAIEGLYSATLDDTIDITAKLYFVPETTEESILETISQAIGNHAEMILGVGYPSGEPLLRVASVYPDTSFVIVEGEVADYPDNCANIVFRSNEPSFIAGYIAGRMTKTGIVGFLGGLPIDSVQKFYYGFSAGVKTAEISSGMEIKLLTDYVNSFSDKKTGYEKAKKMYAEGADIIFAVAGDSGIGAIEAAEDLNKYIIGVDTDQNYLAPLNILFSVTKNIPNAVSWVVKNYATAYSSGNERIGIKDAQGLISIGYAEDKIENAVGISTIIDIVPDYLKVEKDIIEQLIRNGKLNIPSTQEEYNTWIPPNLVYYI